MFDFGEYITVLDSIYITVVAITIVFTTLILIALVVGAFKKIFKEDTSTKIPVVQNNVQNTIVNLDELVNDENKLVATLVATIAANENDEDKIYRVTKIKEI